MPGTGPHSAVSGARSSIAFTIIVTVLTSLGALAILALLAFSGAPGTLAVATVLAALPVGPLVGCYLWLDRYEPEPRTLLAAGLLWGCFVATAAAIVLQGIGGFVLGLSDNVDIIVSALPPRARMKPGRVAAIKRQAFLTILDEEESRLSAVPGLIDVLRKEVG